MPGEGATLDVWILGSSGGVSASVAGERGLPFAANYHVAPSAVLEAIAAYRAAFRPSASACRAVRRGVRRRRRRPDRRRGAASWRPATRCGCAASAPPRGRSRSRRPPRPAATCGPTTTAALVQDRVDTQFVGSPETRRRPARGARRGDRRRRAAADHDHPRPRRPRPLLRADRMPSGRPADPASCPSTSGPIGPELKDRSRVPA